MTNSTQWKEKKKQYWTFEKSMIDNTKKKSEEFITTIWKTSSPKTPWTTLQKEGDVTGIRRALQNY